MTSEGARDLWIFRKGQWEELAEDMPFKFTGQHSATAIGKTGDYFFLVSSSHENISEAWLWRGATKTWEKIASTPPPPRNSAAVACDEVRNCIVVFGGEIGIESTDEVWELSLTTNTWKKAFPK